MVEEDQEAAAVQEEIQDLNPLPETTGGAAVEEGQLTATVGHQEEVVETVEILTTLRLVTEGWGWRP